MYVAKEFTASAVDDIRVDFTCARCGESAVADVIAVGHGSATAPFLIGQQAARDEASDEASRRLPAAARMAAGIAGCPKCGACDAAALRSAWIDAALRVLASWVGVLFFVASLFGGLVGRALGRPLVIVGSIAVFALVLGLLTRRQLGKLLRETRARVTWRESGRER
jgi:hypothetical protein